MAKENKTKYAVLGLLSRAPMSGYDIKMLTDRSISHFWNENFGHLYPVLRRLEREGLISREVRSTPGRPDRSVYSLTPEGTAALDAWLIREPEEPPNRIEILLQLFFSSSQPLAVVREKIEAEKRRAEQRLEVFDAIEQHIKEYHSDQHIKDAPYWLMTLSFGRHRSRAVAAWCEETIERLREMEAERTADPERRERHLTPHDE
jgi:PadR family transcriptional regulator AphA